MQDIYAAIVGEPPTEQEKLALLAQKLRNQTQIGQLGQITGDKVLAPLGQSIAGRATEQAKDIGQQASTNRWRKTQQAMNEASILSRAKEAEAQRAFLAQQGALNRASQRDLQQLRYQQALDVAKLKGSGGSKLTMKNVQELSGLASDLTAMDELVSRFKPEYAGTALPTGRALKNYAAAHGMGSQADKDAQKWWAEWDRLYTLKERNKMFGSALTATEKAAWDKANISTDMTPMQIMANVKTILALKEKAMVKLNQDLIHAGYDENKINAILGGMEGVSADVAPDPFNLDDESSGAPDLSSLSLEQLQGLLNELE